MVALTDDFITAAVYRQKLRNVMISNTCCCSDCRERRSELLDAVLDEWLASAGG